jgi:Cys-rich repeat protein
LTCAGKRVDVEVQFELAEPVAYFRRHSGMKVTRLSHERTNMRFHPLAIAMLLLFATACGGDDDTAADRLGVGAECAKNTDCTEGQSCLAFKGGYCGIENCTENADCPEGSACVAHDDGHSYCFRTCAEKAECNRNRSADVESNCSSSITFVEKSASGKACVPPSSDTQKDADTMKK